MSQFSTADNQGDNNNDVLLALSKLYFALIKIDLVNNSFTIVSADQNLEQNLTTITGAQEMMLRFCETMVARDYYDKLKEFVNLGTLTERLSALDTIEVEYMANDTNWHEARFIVDSRNTNGVVQQVIYAPRVISEKKRIELQQQQMLQHATEELQKANASKSAFLAHMSHDIRTPINGVLGMVEIIKHNPGNKNRIEDCLEKIQNESEHLLTLVNDVLDLNKLESGEICLQHNPFSLDSLCQNIAEIVAHQSLEKGLVFTSNYVDLETIQLVGSPVHLKQILLNILSNALKYNRPGGYIFANVEKIHEQTGNVTYEFTIKDTGIGMAPDFVEHHIFEPFSQANRDARTEFKGVGLGMNIVKKLVEKLSGTIQVESSLGEGTLVTVRLPFEVCNNTNLLLHEEEETDIEGMKLLVVEDNELNLEIVEFLLSEAGAILTTAKDGLEAVAAFDNAPDNYFDAVLMDLMMPVMDGLTATRTIRKLKNPNAKKIPIIAMTANAFAEDIQKCLEAGMNAHIAKPLQLKKMLQTIARFRPEKEAGKVYNFIQIS